MTLDTREIYPNAPLEFVACEVRYPFVPALAEDAILPHLHRSFYEWLPLIEPAVETTVLVGPGGVPPPASTKQVRFLTRDRTLSVLVTPNLVSVETTSYSHYETFREHVSRALNALVQANAGVAGLLRVGLRYVDEIRILGIEGVDESWTDYIDHRLAAPVALTLGSLRPAVFQGTLQFELGEGERVVMRFGAMKGQSVGNAPLRRRDAKQSGAYFLVDIDSFWATEDGVPEFEIESALAMCDKLHHPVRELFEASVTERLREEVLRRALDDNR